MKRYYNNEIMTEDAICCECGDVHVWNEEDCEVYGGKFLCSECFKEKYGYCNICGELRKYSNMSENIECKECIDGRAI